MRRNLSILVLLFAVLLMAACSESSKNPETTAQAATTSAAEAVSGKTAYWAMYKSAYTWANDVVPLKLESKSLTGVKNDGG
jgi:uncharacterized lipoprotein YajG